VVLHKLPEDRLKKSWKNSVSRASKSLVTQAKPVFLLSLTSRTSEQVNWICENSRGCGPVFPEGSQLPENKQYGLVATARYVPNRQF